ncbi:MAG: DUF4190 domain-containing protein [Motilibacteraceae bacterium]
MSRDDGAHRLRANDDLYRTDLDRTDLRRDDDVDLTRDRRTEHAGLDRTHDLTRRDLVDADGYEQRISTRPAKTSAAAVFALVFGLSSLLSVLTVVLSPLALVLGIIGIVLGVVGLKMARRPGVTGKGTAIGGLVLAIIGTLLAIAVGVGVTTFLNNQSAVNRLQHQVDQMRNNLPQHVDVPGGSTGS